jgi:hypothetical protein
MKILGNRISVLKKENVLSVVILAATDKKKVRLLFLWLFAWTVCGVIVAANYTAVQNNDAKLFLIIYLSFWAYFEFKIARAFIWKKSGKEKIWIQHGILYYQRQLGKRGKIKEYSVELTNDFKIIDVSPANFADSFNQSFWVKGGERLEFISQGRVLRFGMQIHDEEARAVFNEMKAFIFQGGSQK